MRNSSDDQLREANAMIASYVTAIADHKDILASQLQLIQRLQTQNKEATIIIQKHIENSEVYEAKRKQAEKDQGEMTTRLAALERDLTYSKSLENANQGLREELQKTTESVKLLEKDRAAVRNMHAENVLKLSEQLSEVR